MGSDGGRSCSLSWYLCEAPGSEGARTDPHALLSCRTTGTTCRKVRAKVRLSLGAQFTRATPIRPQESRPTSAATTPCQTHAPTQRDTRIQTDRPRPCLRPQESIATFAAAIPEAEGGAPTRPRPIMIATDLAARGLDFPGTVDHVVNFDFPVTSVDYLHRSGRTARAGKTGEASTRTASPPIRLPVCSVGDGWCAAMRCGATVA